jgi:MCP family monocarboxylic acid transporter-like MFS transporter 10
MEKPQENPTTVSDQYTEHSDTTGQKQEHQFPEGGLRAWLVVLGSAFAMFSTFGYINSFGSVPNFHSTLALVSQCIDSAALVYIKNITSAIS